MSATVYGYIYEITNRINNKVYIGQTVQTVARRWQQHRYNALAGKSGMAIHRAMKKHGLENFYIEEICTADSKEELDALEIKYIAELNCIGSEGYNIKFGGANGKHSEESKQKMVESATKRFEDAVELEKFCKAQQKRWTNPDAREKAREKAIEQFSNPEARKKMSEARKGQPAWNKGIPATEEARQKISDSLIGRTPTFLDKKHSEESKKKISEAKKGKTNPSVWVPIIDSNGNVYKSLQDAGISLNITPSAISKVLRGYRKPSLGTKGLTFSYYTPKDSQDKPESISNIV